VAGWRLLAQLARGRGRDADRPERARKVGNEALPGGVRSGGGSG